MKLTTLKKTLGLVVAASLTPLLASADDIDIFTGASSTALNPRILVVLDNTSNWARQSQKWPDGSSQGQSEAQAISEVIDGLSDNVNFGLMEFVTVGNANENGGFIRSHVLPMNATNKASMKAKMATIASSINDPTEKRNSHTPYGNLMYDAYNYFAGSLAYSPGGTPSSLADARGYSTSFTRFQSPIESTNVCGKSYIIFIGNPNSSGPAADDATNTAALAALSGAAGGPTTVTQLGLPNFSSQNVQVDSTVGHTAACYATQAEASTAELATWNATAACLDTTEGCAITTPTTPIGPLSCAAGSQTYTVKSIKTEIGPATETLTSTVNDPAVNTNGYSTEIYFSANAAAAAANNGTDQGNVPCPASPADVVTATTRTKVSYACTYTAGLNVTAQTTSTTNATTDACFVDLASWTASGDIAGLTCATGSTCSYNANSGNASGCPNSTGSRHYTVTRTSTNNVRWYLTRRAVKTTKVYAITYGAPVITNTTLGSTALCYSSAPATTTDYAAACSAANTVCTYNNAPTSTTFGSCPAGKSVYAVTSSDLTITNVATGTTTTDTGPRNADEWARFMSQKGIPVANSTVRPTVTTFTIDVYNRQPNATQTALLLSMAKNSGGTYFAARSKGAIVDALKSILIDIQAKDSAFASTSLPVNATNRSQNENQVYIGMFRPDSAAKPRWFGNLKRYQLVLKNGAVELGDFDKELAVNNDSGFVRPCARSFWTTDSGSYWSGVTSGDILLANDGTPLSPTPTSSCTKTGVNLLSDLPDGPQVEKGSAAQILRMGNVAGVDTGNRAVNRNMYTVHNGAMAAFSTTTSGLTSDVVSFIRGADVNNERGLNRPTETRPSIHGDVIHSRPLPLNYGGTDGVTIYYGANDGALHAVNAATGVERWSFIAPEFFGSLSRLKTNSPLINYPGLASTISPVPTRKNYYFDGSTGVYQNRDNSKVWIFPSMRRGGRMVYALDVSNPATPVYKWKVGCPNLNNDDDCTTDMTEMGQSWSSPIAAFIKGNSVDIPVVIFGGGYDNCEDADTSTPSCGSTKGNYVYIVNASTGALIKKFATARNVAADVAVVDVNGDSFIDYAYAADTGGNIYRIDFVASPTTAATGLAVGDWAHRKVAFTNGDGRKFLFSPAIFYTRNKAYIAIGSGDREHPLYTHYPYALSLTKPNRFYVYKDDLTLPSSTAADNLDALQDYSNSTCTTTSVFPGSTLKGWYKNLNRYGQGEQVVTSALIVGGLVAFSTNRPEPPSTSTCSNTLGQARGYWVNLFNGSGAIGANDACGGDDSKEFVGGGLPPTPVFAPAVPILKDDGTTTFVSASFGTACLSGCTSTILGPQPPKSPGTQKRRRVYQAVQSD